VETSFVTANFSETRGSDLPGRKPKGSPEIIARKVKLHLYDNEEVKFSNDNITLAGTLTLPLTKGPHPGVVLIHGSDPNTRFRHEPTKFRLLVAHEFSHLNHRDPLKKLFWKSVGYLSRMYLCVAATYLIWLLIILIRRHALSKMSRKVSRINEAVSAVWFFCCKLLFLNELRPLSSVVEGTLVSVASSCV
jgi:hypothetical protein